MSKLLSFAQLVGQFQTVKIQTLLWLRKTKANKAGLAPIYLRVSTNNRHRFENSTGIYVAPEQWDAPSGRIKGKSQVIAKQNEHLQLLKAHVAELVNLMKATGRPVTLSALRQQLAAPTVGAAPCYLDICRRASESRDKSNPGAQTRATGILALLGKWNGYTTHRTPKLLPLDEFTPRRAAEFYHWLQHEQALKTVTANGYVATLIGLFRYAAELGEVEIGDNPFRALRKQKNEKPAQRLHLTRAQVEQLRTAQNIPRKEALARDIYLAQYYLHGSRIGAVLMLRWQDVGPDTVRLQVEKGGPLKQIALCPALREVLARQGTGSAERPVFAKALGADFFLLDAKQQYQARRKAIGSVNEGLKRLAARLGIEGRLRSHTARHTLAAHAAELGGIEVAQRMLGHTNQAMTAHYVGPQHNEGLAQVERALYGAGVEPTPPTPEPEGGKIIPLFGSAA